MKLASILFIFIVQLANSRPAFVEEVRPVVGEEVQVAGSNQHSSSSGGEIAGGAAGQGIVTNAPTIHGSPERLSPSSAGEATEIQSTTSTATTESEAETAIQRQLQKEAETRCRGTSNPISCINSLKDASSGKFRLTARHPKEKQNTTRVPDEVLGSSEPASSSSSNDNGQGSGGFSLTNNI